MAKFKIQKSATVNQYADTNNVIGGTGGLTTISGNQVRANVYVAGASVPALGSLLRSKGKSKFLVNDVTAIQDEYITTGNAYVITSVGTTNWAFLGGPQSAGVGDIFTATNQNPSLTTTGVVNLLGVCTLANIPNANLSAGSMSIGVDTAVISYANVNVYVGGSTTYAYVTYLTANVSGPKTPGVGDYLRGTGITGNVKIASVTANTVTGQSNANVSLGIAQTVGNLFNQASIYSGGYAARLSNKFVVDFNGNKYQWTFSDPTATTVRIPGA
jgi:hypothetical protein